MIENAEKSLKLPIGLNCKMCGNSISEPQISSLEFLTWIPNVSNYIFKSQ